MTRKISSIFNRAASGRAAGLARHAGGIQILAVRESNPFTSTPPGSSTKNGGRIRFAHSLMWLNIVSQKNMTYSLKDEGDPIEIASYDVLIKPQFPSYEVFWQKFVVPLSHRPGDKQLKTDAELATIGKGHAELCLAQLHYSVLRQLDRTRRLMQDPHFGVDHLVFALSTLVGAQDCAFEVLERFKNPTAYDPWLNKKQKGSSILGSKQAQEAWKKRDSYPLQDIRDYRNSMVHGRTLPGIVSPQGILVPKIGNETSYFDWRLITAAAMPPVSDFDLPSVIMKAAFDKTVAYFESNWKSELLPHV